MVPPSERSRRRKLAVRAVAPAAVAAAAAAILLSGPCRAAPPRSPIEVHVPNVTGKEFSLHATATGLFPGATRPLRLRVVNPNPFSVSVTTLAVLVRSDPASPQCRARTYVRTGGLDRRLRVPGRSTRDATLRITMLRGAPDRCRGATFPLRLTAEAVRP